MAEFFEDNEPRSWGSLLVAWPAFVLSTVPTLAKQAIRSVGNHLISLQPAPSVTASVQRSPSIPPIIPQNFAASKSMRRVAVIRYRCDRARITTKKKSREPANLFIVSGLGTVLEDPITRQSELWNLYTSTWGPNQLPP